MAEVGPVTETPTDYVADAVQAFLTAMDAKPNADLRATLVQEEAKEVIEAAANLLKEMADLAYVIEGFNQLSKDTPRLAANVQFLESDPIVNQGLRAAMMFAGMLNPDLIRESFRRVHESNMSKLGPDGKPVRNEAGKVMKGPNYKPPVLTDLVK